MRAFIIYLAFVLLISFDLACAKWRLAWSDDFTGTTVDTTKWNLRNKAGNFGNGEKQWYDPTAISVANGKLVITGSKQKTGGMDYKSGWLDTQDKFSATYGRYEITAKFPKGKGLWPAIWLLSQDKCWGAGGEIDLAEFRGSYPKEIGCFYHYSNKCCYGFDKCISSKGDQTTFQTTDLTANYYTYALEWWPGNMTWFVGNTKVASYKTSELIYAQDLSPRYLILNNAIGGGYPGNPDSTTPFPHYFYVESVKYFQWRPSCTANSCSGRGCCNPTTAVCTCDPGWNGASCEYDLGTATNNLKDISNYDNRPNGWGNPTTTYLYANTVLVSGGGIRMGLTNSGCPTNCGATPYSSGAWEYIPRYTYGSFAFTAQSSNVKGTAFSLGAAAEPGPFMEQIAFTIFGNETSKVRLYSWSKNYMYLHKTIDTGKDLSASKNTFRFDFAPTSITWYINEVQVHFTNNEVIPQTTRLGMGAYYTAHPEWYGPFTYTGPSYAYLYNTSWIMARGPKLVC